LRTPREQYPQTGEYSDTDEYARSPLWCITCGRKVLTGGELARIAGVGWETHAVQGLANAIRRRCRASVSVGLLALATPVGAQGAPDAPSAVQPAPAPALVERLGTSVQGRPIRARVLGDSSAPHRVLIVGCVHGNERAGIAVTRALRRVTPHPGTAWWIVDTVNPDRCKGALRTRGNARGVDLNRNGPFRWRRLDPPGGTYYAGPRATSEPETRAVVALVRRVRPDVTVWFHQHATLVDLSRGDHRIIRAYGRRVGLPAIDYGTRPGSLSTWQAHAFPRSTPFVVELPAGALSPAKVRAHVAAIGRL
jgi:murein peptide amidase A